MLLGGTKGPGVTGIAAGSTLSLAIAEICFAAWAPTPLAKASAKAAAATVASHSCPRDDSGVITRVFSTGADVDSLPKIAVIA